MKDFFNLYSHGFARMAVATPLVRIGDPAHNAAATEDLSHSARAGRRAAAVPG